MRLQWIISIMDKKNKEYMRANLRWRQGMSQFPKKKNLCAHKLLYDPYYNTSAKLDFHQQFNSILGNYLSPQMYYFCKQKYI